MIEKNEGVSVMVSKDIYEKLDSISPVGSNISLKVNYYIGLYFDTADKNRPEIEKLSYYKDKTHTKRSTLRLKVSLLIKVKKDKNLMFYNLSEKINILIESGLILDKRIVSHGNVVSKTSNCLTEEKDS